MLKVTPVPTMGKAGNNEATAVRAAQTARTAGWAEIKIGFLFMASSSKDRGKIQLFSW
jgi:hypothetical protein